MNATPSKKEFKISPSYYDDDDDDDEEDEDDDDGSVRDMDNDDAVSRSGSQAGELGDKRKSSLVVSVPSGAHVEGNLDPTDLDFMEENGPDRVSCLEAINLSVVLEEMSDQLDVIGTSIDAPQIDLRSKESAEFDAAVNRPMISFPAQYDTNAFGFYTNKYFLLQHYQSTTARRAEQIAEESPATRFRKRLSTVLRDHGIARFTEKGKLQTERTQMNIIADNLVVELVKDCTFDSLRNSLEEENAKYKGMVERIKKGRDDEQRIVDTKVALSTARKDKKRELKEKQLVTWTVEDRMQEMIRRKDMEMSNSKNFASMITTRIKKMCHKSEQKVVHNLQDKRIIARRFTTAHTSMMTTLNKKYTEAQHRLEFWMNKYELDKEALQNDLDTLNQDRARDHERMLWLKFIIKDYEQIAKDDRRIRAIATERQRLSALWTRKATKLQAWWRGEMVRKQIGPYCPVDKKKKKK